MGYLESQRAELEEKLGELRLSSSSIEDKKRNTTQIELDRLRPLMLKLIEQRTDLLLIRQQAEIRSPISGYVHDLKVQGAGFVLRAGAPIMTVIPSENSLQALIRVQPSDIDQVHVNQKTDLRLSAFNARAFPLLSGEIDAVAADVTTDVLTKKHFFEVSVRIPQSELEQLSDQPMVNGMELTAFLKTVSQTPLEYISRPIVSYLSRTFRDR